MLTGGRARTGKRDMGVARPTDRELPLDPYDG